MLSKEEYIQKELDKLNLKPSKKEKVLELIDFTVTIVELNEIISKYRKDYPDNEIEICSGYDYDAESNVIVIRVMIAETEKDFNNRVNSIRLRIEMDYDRMAKALEI